MKIYILSLCLTLSFGIINVGYSQSGRSQQDTTERYYTRLLTSKNKTDTAMLLNQLNQLIKSGRESDLILARNFFFRLNQPKVVDSLKEVLIVRFPLGETTRTIARQVIDNEKDPVKKEQAYLAWYAKFPPTKSGSNNIGYDYATFGVANTFLMAGKPEKAYAYAGKFITWWAPEGLNGLAASALSKGYVKEAAAMAQMSRAQAMKNLSQSGNESGPRNLGKAAIKYSSNILAGIYYKDKKYKEALVYAKEAHDNSETVSGMINSNYAHILAALGKDKEALDILKEAFAAEQVDAEMRRLYQQLYKKIQGSDPGDDAFLAGIDRKMAEKVRKDLAARMVNISAPDFTLTDVDGKVVSLASLKGKIVLLDFWATWCSPCKKSFPAMKLAMDKFKDDPNVRFLFIHTWERQENPTADAKKYITDNNLPFEVLMDLKDPKTGKNKVVEDYKVTGIPTKFVIDKNGNIRFKFVGGADSEDKAVEEVVSMIEMARQN